MPAPTSRKSEGVYYVVVDGVSLKDLVEHLQSSYYSRCLSIASGRN